MDRLYLTEGRPTLIVWGARDTVIPVAHAYHAHDVIPGSRLLEYAKKYGFASDEQIAQLLDSADPAIVRIRETIRQQSKDDMLDFDRLTPFEQNLSRTFLFIWPFVRASIRYPATYVRDYPGGLVRCRFLADITVGLILLQALAILYKYETSLGEVNLGPFVPFQAATEKAADLSSILGLNLESIGDWQVPWISTLGREAYGRKYGRPSGSWVGELARENVPLVDPIQSIIVPRRYSP